jgi:hypothetical protein
VSVVLGREARSPAPPDPAPRAPEAPAREAAPDLVLEKLERPGLGEPLANPFAAPRLELASRTARPAPAPPPPAPVAPPLPFRYLGKFVDGERNAVYLARGDEPFLALPGAALGAEYRVEDVSPGAVTLVYVPLGTRQRLPVPAHD